MADILVEVRDGVRSYGCWRKTADNLYSANTKTMPSIDEHLSGDPRFRPHPAQRCAEVVRANINGPTLFGLLNGECHANETSYANYYAAGPSRTCSHRGSDDAFSVYESGDIPRGMSIPYQLCQHCLSQATPSATNGGCVR